MASQALTKRKTRVLTNSPSTANDFNNDVDSGVADKAQYSRTTDELGRNGSGGKKRKSQVIIESENNDDEEVSENNASPPPAKKAKYVPKV
jgi:hypothetical protein